MTGALPPVTVRAATPADTPAILALLERAFALPAQPERFDWVYVRHAGGAPATSYVAEDAAADRIVGFHGALPFRLWHRGREVRGLYTLEVATDPDYQGRGIFTQLGRAIIDGARGDGTQIIRIFPNLQSAPGFYGKLGYTELAPFPVVARFLGNLRGPVAERLPALAPVAAPADLLLRAGLVRARLARARGRRGGAHVAPLTAFGPWADTLWESLRDTLGTTTIRDSRFLRWRYLEGPHRYTILGLDRGNGPVAFAVVGVRPWKGGKAADLLEVMAAPGDRAAVDHLLAEASLLAAREGAVALRTWVGARHPHAAAFRAAGFRPLPARLRVDYSVGALVVDPEGLDTAEILHIDGWTLTAGDIEYI